MSKSALTTSLEEELPIEKEMQGHLEEDLVEIVQVDQGADKNNRKLRV